jgi:hypothetical protein
MIWLIIFVLALWVLTRWTLRIERGHHSTRPDETPEQRRIRVAFEDRCQELRNRHF